MWYLFISLVRHPRPLPAQGQALIGDLQIKTAWIPFHSSSSSTCSGIHKLKQHGSHSLVRNPRLDRGSTN